MVRSSRATSPRLRIFSSHDTTLPGPLGLVIERLSAVRRERDAVVGAAAAATAALVGEVGGETRTPGVFVCAGNEGGGSIKAAVGGDAGKEAPTGGELKPIEESSSGRLSNDEMEIMLIRLPCADSSAFGRLGLR